MKPALVRPSSRLTIGHSAAGIEEGHAAGVEEGRAAGIEEGIRETARNFAKMGVSIETIAGAVKASAEEVREWLDCEPDD